MWRTLRWSRKLTADQIDRWRSLANAIPDHDLRADAISSLLEKRGYADGAALFTILPAHRDRALLRVLVAYETIVDYLDNVSERCRTYENGQLLHQALREALDPGGPLSDWYRHNGTGDDGGYLAALVGCCREGCARLPSFERVREHIALETRRSLVLGLNHELDPARRDDYLRTWAQQEFPAERKHPWFELSAGASATLIVHALLALAAQPTVSDGQIEAVAGLHWPWVALATTMLDSYADLEEDRAPGGHSYLLHYDSHEAAIARLHECVATSMRLTRTLPRGGRHAVIVGCMIALFLSSDGANSPELRETTRALARSGGSLVRLLVPVLRVWRRVHKQSS
ncbi:MULTISPECIES: DUF2600 family protein [unclassified Conexibacter]|uniref:DUF2600 family protein n=1 Tax=unclassified Conexibacter TaxID=2627773 RepID=UPI00271B9A5E|nr:MULTISPECIES: DUF2600 family protein [unclassified Conexibacter]MDO8197801.1 DUF2600 family protein [Conexibacter sp. CPCC 205762]